MPKISVIIPCYNAERYIEECMESIVNQSIGLENLEIILVDDASGDGTAAKLKKFEEQYPENVILVLCSTNGRQGTARNIGMSYATGDYISFVDSDDYIHRDMYRILLRVMEQEGCDILQFRYTGDSERWIASADRPDYLCYDFSDPENRRSFIGQSKILNESCTTKLYKREIIEEAGVRFAEGVSYEEPLFTYPLKFWVKHVCVMEAPMYFYRCNAQGTVYNYMNRASTILEHLDVQQGVLDFMKNTQYFSVYQREIELYYIHTFFGEPFYFFKFKGFPLALSLVRYMCSAIRKNIPDYQCNPYLGELEQWEQDAIKVIEEERKLDDKQLQGKIGKIMERI